MKHTGEVETGELFERLWQSHPNILTSAPRVNEATGEIDSITFERRTELVESKWKIPEPADGENCDPTDLDLVVVPLLYFDRRGHRVGYGRGFYDRFLARCRTDCVKAGLSFFSPVDRINDAHDGDLPLDICITPETAYRWAKDSRNLVITQAS